MSNFVFFQLYVLRKKVARGEEVGKMEEIDALYMSDEEDGEGAYRGKWLVRKTSWRSEVLEKLLSTLQKRVDERDLKKKQPKYERINGPPSTRGPPKDGPYWAIIKLNQPEDDQECPQSSPVVNRRGVHPTKRAPVLTFQEDRDDEGDGEDEELTNEKDVSACQGDDDDGREDEFDDDDDDENDSGRLNFNRKEKRYTAEDIISPIVSNKRQRSSETPAANLKKRYPREKENGAHRLEMVNHGKRLGTGKKGLKIRNF